MPIMPEGNPGGVPLTGSEVAAGGTAPVEPLTPTERKKSRHHRLLMVCFAIFAFEVGLFLVLFPWMDAWNANSLQDLAPSIQGLWQEPYFRGAVTGLGVLNIYVALRQLVGLLRRA